MSWLGDWGVALVLAPLFACGVQSNLDGPARLDTCAPAAAAIVGGGLHETFLRTSDAEVEGIGRLQSAGLGTEGPICTGVLIRAGLFVTASHCLEIDDPELRFPTSTFEVERSARHPTLDVALFHVRPRCVDQVVRAMPIAAAGTDAAVGQRALLAGYGLTEDDRVGELRFLIEPLAVTTETLITVDGSDRSGACLGDSGGPLIVRDAASGHVALLGVLTSGAADCRGKDSYARLDAVLEWLAQEGGTDVSELTTGPRACGRIDDVGQCFDQLAVWCENQALRADLCSGTSACGWDPDAGGHRCSDRPTCAGDDRGVCEAGDARYCAMGRASTDRCASQQLDCAFDPITGTAECRAPEQP